MEQHIVIEKFYLERAVNVHNFQKLSDSQKEVIKQTKEFGIDQIYFSQDEKNSYPAVFIKKVVSFDRQTLELIADIHKKAWNYRKVSFLYVYSDTEIRFYNCIEMPVLLTDKTNFEEEMKRKELAGCKLSDTERLEELNRIFSSVAIDSGLIWTIEEAADIRKKINLQRRVDKYLVESLTQGAEQLKNELEINLIHRLILRSLFLLYLEDRKATDTQFYAQIKDNAVSYFDILKDLNATYSLFEKLENHFNGNVFSIDAGEIQQVKKEHLEIIRQCFTVGYQKVPLFPDWRLFDFSIIQIELISQIYENFLAKVAPIQKKASGVYYTPPALVTLILNEKLPVNTGETQYKFKILDPACGSGIFLVESFKRLVKRYENAQNIEKLSDFETLKSLLTDNIYGIECDSNAIKVAAFSLYLGLVDCLDPKTLWQGKDLPYLINDPEDKTLLNKQGHNLYKRDAIEQNVEIECNSFDLVVGNPPFGTETKDRKLPASIRNYCDKNGFAKEMVLPFLHKAVQLAPKGEIALIFTTKVLTNTQKTYQKFREWLLQKCYIEKVYNFSILRKAPKDIGGQLFGDAVGPISIVFYKKETPQNPRDRIVYYAPKTYLKSNVLEGIVIDSTDVKYLPREECQKPDTKIWKIAMWGGMADFELIKKINKQATSNLKTYFNNPNRKWKYNDGLNSDSMRPDFVPEKIIETKAIERYYTSERAVKSNHDYYRIIDANLFLPPYVAIKKGQKNVKITASLITHHAYCKSGVFVFNNEKEGSIDIMKSLVSFINSDIASYYLFLNAASWGIEREQIFLSEYLELPFFFENVDLRPFSVHFDLLITELQKDFPNAIDVDNKSDKLNEELWKIVKINENERILIRDTLMYGLDFYEKQHESKALYPVSQNQLIEYSEKICRELSDFLDGQDLFANATVYNVEPHSPLYLIKISFEPAKKKVVLSNEKVGKELKQLDRQLWEEKASNIYFRKKLNYYDGNDIFIIRPNQRRFWSQSMAMEDASDLILEILNMEE